MARMRPGSARSSTPQGQEFVEDVVETVASQHQLASVSAAMSKPSKNTKGQRRASLAAIDATGLADADAETSTPAAASKENRREPADALDKKRQSKGQQQQDQQQRQEMDRGEEDEEDSDSVKLRVSVAAKMSQNRVGLSVMPEALQAQADQVVPESAIKSLRQVVTRLHLANMSQGHPTRYFTELKRVAQAGYSTSEIPVDPHTVRYTQDMTLGYVGSRMAASYGAIDFAFRDLQRLAPSFQPVSMLDFGTGPGTAVWAAKSRWRDSLQKAVGIDVSQSMLDVAEDFNAIPQLGVQDFQTVRFLSYQEDVPEEQRKDLIVAAFSLSEMPTDVIRAAAIRALWSQTRDMLVLVDRGTPAGFRMIAEARQQILDLETQEGESVPNAHVVGPCSHDKTCPLLSHSQWCHFSQRVHRGPVMRNLTPKNNQDHEDVKFSYVILRRGQRPLSASVAATTPSAASRDFVTELPEWALDNKLKSEMLAVRQTELQPLLLGLPRAVAPPIKGKQHILLDLCTNQGQIKRVVVAKSHGRQMYKDARKLHWGDQWPHRPLGAVTIRAPLQDKAKEDEERSQQKLDPDEDADQDRDQAERDARGSVGMAKSSQRGKRMLSGQQSKSQNKRDKA
ncbi:mitochondrial small ribosomal subunit Rsm22-domain-containing protein [Entophlyctis helioformis]|nr:mitochondrial small ribosomal subunit Rsm22-domain-containing protein [Entophlyctis helioformis]